MSINYKEVLDFYRDKTVLITGNTGFKGSWLTFILTLYGAKVVGYSLEAPTSPSLFGIIGLDNEPNLIQYYEDVRDLDKLMETFNNHKPDVVIHLAAQPIVRDSYKNPVNTYSINVMGTVNICECVRLSKINREKGGLGSEGWNGVKSFLNVTTDKVYKNNEWEWGYRETDFLDGLDPYSNSKSCSELVTHSYRDSFFKNSDGNYSVAISTARAGNVIGGGDFANDRIIPDCIRAIQRGVEENSTAVIGVRNPYSTRPYQHVLEPLFMYLTIAKKQYENIEYSGFYNIGPDDKDCVRTGELVSLFCNSWNITKSQRLPSIKWENTSEINAPHEAGFLKLDCSRIKKVFGWKSNWGIKEAIENTASWNRVWLEGGDIKEEMKREIKDFLNRKQNEDD